MATQPGFNLFVRERKVPMNTLKTEKIFIPHPETTRMKNFGWYGVAFFFIKGVLWFITPFIIYVIN
ncbi:MAG TPA: hypothetical protein DD706_22360 [Nitrospiraceae bacterium]|nr:hypothetical protein [Nitrospiraceae bacterium]